MKKSLLFILFLIIAVLGLVVYFLKPEVTIQKQSQCQVSEMIFYYADTCHWCKQVKDEGTLDKLEKLGVKISKINTAVGPIRHKFESVPTFVIGNQVLTGYKTFDEFKELLGCLK